MDQLLDLAALALGRIEAGSLVDQRVCACRRGWSGDAKGLEEDAQCHAGDRSHRRSFRAMNECERKGE
jgi:hypothetical protein